MLILAEILVAGLTQGAILCVFAFGLSLVYGTSRVLNFAHGSLYMLGAYLAWAMVAAPGGPGLPLAVAAIVLIPLMFGIGMVLEMAIIRPLRSHRNWKTATMMITLGLAFVLDNLFLITAGPGSKVMPRLLDGTVDLGGVVIGLHDIIVIVTALVVVAGLELFLRLSPLGQAMRAVSQDNQGARMVGIDPGRIFAYAFGLSVALVGLAAVLLAPLAIVSPLAGWPPFLKAFVIVVLGGLGSTQGVLYAAFALATVEAAVSTLLGASLVLPVWLAILLVVLMIRPQGLMGKFAE